MQVLNINTPELDSGDVDRSFKSLMRYLSSTMEDIDFNLAKSQREIIETDSSNAGLQLQINELRAAVFLLSNSFAGLSNQIDTINEKLVDLDKRVTALEKKHQP